MYQFVSCSPLTTSTTVLLRVNVFPSCCAKNRCASRITFAMPSGYRWSKALSVGLIQKTRTVRAGGGPDVVGDVDGVTEGDGDAVRVGLALGDPVTLPVQVVPLRVKLVGTGLLEVQDPLNPNDVLPPVAKIGRASCRERV